MLTLRPMGICHIYSTCEMTFGTFISLCFVSAEYTPQHVRTDSGNAALDLSRATLVGIIDTTNTVDHFEKDKADYSGMAHSHLGSFRPVHNMYHKTSSECENTQRSLTNHVARPMSPHAMHALMPNKCNVATEHRQFHSYSAAKSHAPYGIITVTDTTQNEVFAPCSVEHIGSPIEVCRTTPSVPSAQVPVSPGGHGMPGEDESMLGEGICERMCQKHACDKSGKTSSLPQQKSLHTSRISYNSSYCAKRFTRLGNMRIHSSVKPFKCSICDHVFDQKVQLVRHRASHTDPRPYSCDVCGHRFTWKSSLDSHMLTHTENKPYACVLCTSTFRMAYSLRRHLTTHTGERSFVCDLCGLAFNQSSNMASHRKTHTNARPHRCSDCGNYFVRKYHLRRHREIHTKEQTYAVR